MALLPLFLTVGEVAKLMRLSKMTIYRMIHNGEIEYAPDTGRCYRVVTQSLMERHPYITAGHILKVTGETSFAGERKNNLQGRQVLLHRPP
jgi:excisionase family DNA binding protein